MKYLPIIIIFLFLSYSGQAQKLVDPQNVWSVLASGSGPNTSSFWYQFRESEIIDGITYQALYFSSELDSMNWSKTGDYFREDTLGKVYKHIGPSNEILLYDFTMEIGDSAAVHSDFFNEALIKVVNIDSVQLLNGEYRKRFMLEYKDTISDYTFSEEWIQGIGNLKDFRDGFMGELIDYNARTLCVSNDGEQLYMDPGGSCFLSNNKDLDINSIEVYPNPTFDQLYIKSDKSADRMVIYDLLGKSLLTVNPHDVDQGKSIDISSLKSGMYFIKIEYQDFVFTYPLIKR